MIKHINHQNFSTTPFVAAKSWDLYNNPSVDSITLEGDSEDVIAFEYPDGTFATPILNRDCDVSIENQDSDIIQFQEGSVGSGLFDPDTEPQNNDGTYKRSVHDQIRVTFYNKFNNPIQIFGVEHIDFPLSQTLRNLDNYFRLFTVPQNVFGEKIVPNTVRFYDYALDDNVEIFDDGNQNLNAGYDIFSKIQEVRYLGNDYHTESYLSICPSMPIRYALGGDGGFVSDSYIPWEIHTSSMLDLNYQARLILGAEYFLTVGDNACANTDEYIRITEDSIDDRIVEDGSGYRIIEDDIYFHGGYAEQCGALIGPTQSIYAAMGDHDLNDFGIAAFNSYFGYSNEYYSWRNGTVQGFVLKETSDSGTELLPLSTQWLWLSQSLETSRQDPSITWRIVQVHSSPVCSTTITHSINPVLHDIPWAEWWIDAVFAGHNHLVERLESGSTAYFVCGGMSNQKTGYGITSVSPYQKWWFADANDTGYEYNSGYVYMMLEANNYYLSMSFYSSSVKLSDSGSTDLVNGVMTGNSLVLTKPITIIANFAASAITGISPLSVTFANLSSGSVTYDWYFGDGGTSNEINPTHIYTIPGNYDVRLVAYNRGYSDTEIKSEYINVLPVPSVPPPLLLTTYQKLSNQELSEVSWSYSGSISSSQGYVIDRALDLGSFSSYVTISNNTTHSYLDTNVTYSNTYYYRSYAYSSSYTSSLSNISSAFVQAPAAKLTGSQIGFETQSYLSWSFLGHYSMSLYRSTDSGSTWPITYSVSPLTYSYYDDNTISYGNTYYYQIQETKQLGELMSDMVDVYISSSPIPITTSLCNSSSSFASQLFTASLDVVVTTSIFHP